MSDYSKIIIYYFSGTGNSAKVCEWISSLAHQKQINAEQINIGKTDRLHIKKPDPGALLIFISPIHGFNYPPVMMHFIMRFPRGKNPVVLMNTRAGMLIRKFITPGLTGIAFLFSSFFLKLKGYKIRGWAPFDMPSNWLSLHPGLNMPTIKFIHARIKERVTQLSDTILQGKNSFKNWYELVLDLLIAPVSVLYYFIGRFFFSKTYYAGKECDNCGLCVRECPANAIKTIKERPFWTFDCESCMHCMSHCPKKAIHTGHGYSIATLILSFSITWPFLDDTFFIEIQVGSTLAFLVKNLIFFGIFFIVHRVLHQLMHFPLVRKTIEYTSLTKYKFWGNRYRALKDSDFE